MASEVPKHARCWASPDRAALETCSALGLLPRIEHALRDVDHGRWSGRPIKDVAHEEPAAFAAWLSDLSATPHAGESIDAMTERVGAWMADRVADEGSLLAVAGSMAVRAAICAALGIRPASPLRVDVEPLSFVSFSSNGTRWSLQFAAKGTGPARIK